MFEGLYEEIKIKHGQSGTDGQPYKRMKRIELRVTNQEFSKLRELAYQARYTNLAQYLREIGLSQSTNPAHRKRQQALRQCESALNKIDDHLSQIRHHLQMYPDTSMDESTYYLLSQIQDVADSYFKQATGGKL